MSDKHPQRCETCEPVQVDLTGTPKRVKPIAGVLIRGRGKHFEKYRDQLIEVGEKNPDFKLTIREEHSSQQEREGK